MIDIITEISATIRRNKLRTALTGFAVAWGIFMLIFLLGAGNGLINAQVKGMNRFMANSMMVGGGSTAKANAGFKEGRRIVLDDKDISATEHTFGSNVDDVGAVMDAVSGAISTDDEYVSASVSGVTPNYADVNKVQMLSGRFINQIDMTQKRRVIVINSEDAKELMPHQPESIVGRHVKFNGMAFMVVGLYKADGSNFSKENYMPFSTFRTLYGKEDRADRIIFSFHGLESEQQNEDFETQYKARLNTNHQAAADDKSAVWVWNRFTSNLQMSTGIDILRTALWVIGLFTLLSGIVGVSNIMLITVKERTREFGIRKAIGAKPLSILRLIITESVLITTFFGYIGMLAGIAANMYMDATIGHKSVSIGGFEATVFLNPTVGFATCVAATMVMVLAGTAAGLLPAMKAARIRPIEALRAE